MRVSQRYVNYPIEEEKMSEFSSGFNSGEKGTPQLLRKSSSLTNLNANA